MPVSLAQQPRPVGDGSAKVSRVDEVKRPTGAEQPGRFGVIHEEAQVGRNPGWLDRTQVGADHLRARVAVGEINGPDAGASANVQHTLCIVAHGCPK